MGWIFPESLERGWSQKLLPGGKLFNISLSVSLFLSLSPLCVCVCAYAYTFMFLCVGVGAHESMHVDSQDQPQMLPEFSTSHIPSP